MNPLTQSFTYLSQDRQGGRTKVVLTIDEPLDPVVLLLCLKAYKVHATFPETRKLPTHFFKSFSRNKSTGYEYVAGK